MIDETYEYIRTLLLTCVYNNMNMWTVNIIVFVFEFFN